MKKIFFITFLIVGLTAGYGFAQMGGHMQGQGMMGGQGQQQTGDNPGAQGYYPCPQMMGPGSMGPGMMGGGMGRGMMSGAYGQQGDNAEQYRKFLDDTATLRKKLHDKKFEYFEAQRNPDTTRDALLKIEKEIRDIQWDIYVKSVK